MAHDGWKIIAKYHSLPLSSGSWLSQLRHSQSWQPFKNAQKYVFVTPCHRLRNGDTPRIPRRARFPGFAKVYSFVASGMSTEANFRGCLVTMWHFIQKLGFRRVPFRTFCCQICLFLSRSRPLSCSQYLHAMEAWHFTRSSKTRILLKLWTVVRMECDRRKIFRLIAWYVANIETDMKQDVNWCNNAILSPGYAWQIVERS